MKPSPMIKSEYHACLGMLLSVFLLLFSRADAAPPGLTFYSHGSPTEYEQLMLELVNRARANPGAEAVRLGIDLNQGLSPGTIINTPKQPLAWHPSLITAARGHSQWMIDADVFSHTGAGGSTASQRAQSAGYPSGAGENIAWKGTQGTVVMETFTRDMHDSLFISPGHRQNICLDSYREIGVGIKEGVFISSNQNWNATMTTQKFGSSPNTSWPFVLGVAYYDFNANSAYDPGEGIPGLEVQVAGSSHYTLTAPAGGYTIPRPSSAATRAVSFQAPGFSQSFPVAMAAGVNHKVDLALAYPPPVLSGNATPYIGLSNAYTPSVVPGATDYQVKVFSSSPAVTDGANNLSRVVDGTSSSYNAISTSVKHEGTGSYRFAHPVFEDQTLTYQANFLVGAAANIQFRSRLGWATSVQVAHVEVSKDGGASWTSIYSQAGTDNSGEGSFQSRSASLAAFQGDVVKIRFRYAVSNSAYNGTANGIGWYVDSISFTNVNQLTVQQSATIAAGTSYGFTPPGAASYLLQATPYASAQAWPPGPLLAVQSVAFTGGFANWAATMEASAGLAAGTISNAPTGDHSGDGVANLLAYAMGLNPTVRSTPIQRPHWKSEGGGMIFEYTINTAAIDITAGIQLSTNLVTWHAPGAAALGVTTVDSLHSTQGSVQRRRIHFPNGMPQKIFARMHAVKP